jgi:hypothetical protein
MGQQIVPGSGSLRMRPSPACFVLVDGVSSTQLAPDEDTVSWSFTCASLIMACGNAKV